MIAAPRVELTASRTVRVDYLVRAYDNIIRDRALLDRALRLLPVYPGRKKLAAWGELADAGDFTTLADAVVEQHYDPAYERSRRTDQSPRLAAITLDRLDDPGLDLAAKSVAHAIREALGQT